MDKPIRHAYLIIAHANPYVLEKLILLLDDYRNDIYVHIDRKVKNFDFNYYQALSKKSELKFINRIDVRWGSVSQIAVELSLFKAAHDVGQYSYYHLISGSDLPIKSQNTIHDFFKINADKEFIGFSDDLINKERVNKLHFFSKHMRITENDGTKRIFRWLRERGLSLQRFLNYNYGKDILPSPVYGSNWASISSRLVEELLKNEKWFLDFYKYSNCGDEIYKHSFVAGSAFVSKVYDQENELRSCMRFMDWQRGRPYTFRKEDFELIVKSEMLFARKFEDNIDTEIVDLIFNHVMNQQ